MNHDAVSPTRRAINLTAEACYREEGAGIGAGGEALRVLEQRTTFKLLRGMRVAEVGCASLQLAHVVLPLGVDYRGVDIHLEDSDLRQVETLRTGLGEACGTFEVDEGDVSHYQVPIFHNDDQYDAVFCTETIEHLSNPYFMCAQVKRALKPGGVFVLAFPRPEDNLGYGGGKHAHVYPGFLLRDSFELFMRQLFFKQVHRHENGSSAWYVFANYKGYGIVDVFSMTTGNYDDATLFEHLDAYQPPISGR